uniref:Uncharacterized protein n=1 Tax=Cucumis melo TaxID=3656 RepID=A0A9I9DP17_CUCME
MEVMCSGGRTSRAWGGGARSRVVVCGGAPTVLSGAKLGASEVWKKLRKRKKIARDFREIWEKREIWGKYMREVKEIWGKKEGKDLCEKMEK